jgi:hypothetical protein
LPAVVVCSTLLALGITPNQPHNCFDCATGCALFQRSTTAATDRANANKQQIEPISRLANAAST